MTLPRKNQISLVDTKYYHCMSRCVRRAFLCGEDAFSGESYEHRRQWVEDKIFFLTRIFCIDICAFAVMSNHLHLVLHVDDMKAKSLNDREVVIRWHKLFKGTLLTQKYLSDDQMTEAELTTLSETIAVYRKRLFDISWFMRILNEDISRRANKEDGCKGHFWEGRFKSQALLDESALLACMAYVDLNPIRAQMASKLEDSEHTSIQKRIESAKKTEQPALLLPFTKSVKDPTSKALPFALHDYIELVAMTAKCIRQNKKGYIEQINSKLKRFNLDLNNWMILITEFTRIFHGAVGKEKVLRRFCEHVDRLKKINLTACRRYFS